MLRVYNTLSGKKEEFRPFESGKVRMYVCGLTVQNYSHIGHIRGAINYDVIRRYLEYKGYEVYQIQNFTDINEKIVSRAREEGLTPEELADKYTEAYLEDIDNLNIKRADSYCTATDHIQEMQELTRTLIEKGYAYERNGNVYFSVEEFEDYGKLSGRNLEDMEAGTRFEIDEDKKHPLDFALWKRVEDEDVVAWKSPWGRGWPGWHIECSAMSMKHLGPRFDIHGGGTDLIFPHHENEIAQSEAYSGQKPFVKYWLHNGTVNIKGEKMSKSLGNFYTTRELLDKFTADEIRYFLLTKHYHSPIDFSLEELERTGVSLNKLINTHKSLNNLLARDIREEQDRVFGHEEFIDLLKFHRRDFEEAMDDDFNTARAIGVLHELATDINGFIHDKGFTLNQNSQLLVEEARNLLLKLAGILGLTLTPDHEAGVDIELTSRLIDYILELRAEARAEQNWELADRIRDDLQQMGIQVKDTPQGVTWDIQQNNKGQ